MTGVFAVWLGNQLAGPVAKPVGMPERQSPTMLAPGGQIPVKSVADWPERELREDQTPAALSSAAGKLETR